ncbi:MAG TPA: hypothetical protein VMZ03_04990 [Chitinophagaceae bacterium]|nr:hypothetical protein [Chitinophagaceae bacterium]
MNRKILTIVLAVLLIASFFLPIGTHTSTSPFDIVQGPSYGSEIEGILLKYGWLLIPISGLMLLIGALNNGNYFAGRGLWTILPLIALLYLIIRPLTLMGGRFDIGGLIKGLGVGTWLALIASLVLALYHPRR